MYYSAFFRVSEEGQAWIEHALISAQDSQLAARAAAVVALEKEHQGTARTAQLQQIRSHAQWPVVDADAMFGDTAQDAEAAKPSAVKAMAGRILEALSVQGIHLDRATCTQALLSALYEADWLELAKEAQPIQPAQACSQDTEQKLYGPQIKATFIPQAYVSNDVVEVEGRRLVDVTEQVLGLDLLALRTLTDSDASSDALVDVMELEHAGPYCVEVEQAVREFFAVADLADVTADMQNRARQRAFERKDVDVTKGPSHVFAEGTAPLTVSEMARMGWHFDCVVQIPVRLLGDVDAKNAYVSRAITGNEVALEDIGFSVFDAEASTGTLAVRVTGRVSAPHACFDLDSDSAAFGDKASLRRLLKALLCSDVFEMESAERNTRFRILDVDKERLSQLASLDTLTSSDWAKLAVLGVVEFVDPLDTAVPNTGLWWTMRELAQATFMPDGTFRLVYQDEPTIVRFF